MQTQLQQVQSNLQNLAFLSQQNPHVANMQDQFALQQIGAKAQREGSERVNDAFQAFAEEMRNNYKTMAERCQQLEVGLVKSEKDLKVEKEAHSKAVQESKKTIQDLTKSIEEQKNKISSLTRSNNSLQNRVEILEEKFEIHRHDVGNVWVVNFAGNGTHLKVPGMTTGVPRK